MSSLRRGSSSTSRRDAGTTDAGTTDAGADVAAAFGAANDASGVGSPARSPFTARSSSSTVAVVARRDALRSYISMSVRTDST